MGDVPDYLIIGHVTKDLLRDGSWVPGGTATYSSLTAARLGLQVGVVTSCDESSWLYDCEPNIRAVTKSSTLATVFENIYLDGYRRQYLRSVAENLALADVPPAWRAAPIVHIGPMAQEVDTELPLAFPGALLGVTPQGWLRRWDDRGAVSFGEFARAERVFSKADVVVLSPEDVDGDRRWLDLYGRWARILVITMGIRGAVVCTEGREVRVPSYEAQEVDPTGAGDVFAAAFLVRLHECGDAFESARFANCVASFVVEGVGTSNVPTRERVEWRLRHGILRT